MRQRAQQDDTRNVADTVTDQYHQSEDENSDLSTHDRTFLNNRLLCFSPCIAFVPPFPPLPGSLPAADSPPAGDESGAEAANGRSVLLY